MFGLTPIMDVAIQFGRITESDNRTEAEPFRGLIPPSRRNCSVPVHAAHRRTDREARATSVARLPTGSKSPCATGHWTRIGLPD
jgi:hypothetical protein